jgi:hypothetical protein
MARYYFHLVDSLGWTQDEDGCEIGSSEEARAWAIASIRSILGEGVRHGLIDLGGRIEIVDESGEVVLMVPFGDAVELRTDKGSPER